VASERYFDLTGVHRTAPRVAMTDIRRAFLCVYVEGTSGRRIGAQARLADSSALGARFIVDTGTAQERVQADVCGDSFTGSAGDAHFTVVWRRWWDPSDSDIVARVVNEDGVAVTGELYLTNFVGVSDEAPVISKCIAPGTEDSVVVWRRDDSLFASLLSYDGGAVRAEFPLATAAGFVGQPSVSALSLAPLLGSAHPTFVAVWDTDYGTDRDVEAVVAAAANSSAGAGRRPAASCAPRRAARPRARGSRRRGRLRRPRAAPWCPSASRQRLTRAPGRVKARRARTTA
jgi:hypothetical protein